MRVLQLTTLFLFAFFRSGVSHDRQCTETITTSETEDYEMVVTTRVAYRYNCGFWGWWWSRCTGYRVGYQNVQRTRIRYFFRTQCCSGYESISESGELLCGPICEGCDNNHLCIAPGTCVCPTGLTGDDCLDDINECQDNNGGCDQICNNLYASYTCTCLEGYAAATDGHSCLEPPRNVTLKPLNSTSLLVDWISSSSFIIDSFGVSCHSSAGSVADEATTAGSNLEYEVNSLQPFSTYRCCVMATTTVGSTPMACQTAQTMEDRPAAPPHNISVNNESAYELIVYWTPPLAPNGIITLYTVYVNGSVACVTSDTNCTVSGLLPYQLAYVRVSANTSVGEGPYSSIIPVRTHQTAPSAVTQLEVRGSTSPDVIIISWERPECANGNITGFEVTVFNLVQDYFTSVSLGPTTLYCNVSEGIKPEVPYTVYVQAFTVVGGGNNTTEVVFTMEGVPKEAPEVKVLNRTNATTATLILIAPTLDSLRGFSTQYVVKYSGSQIHNCTLVNEGSNTIQLTGLNPMKGYCVRIAASTSKGVGPFTNEADEIPLYDNTLFQLLFSEVDNCEQWKEHTADEKKWDFAQELSIKLSSFCDCSIPPENIGDMQFLCVHEMPGVLVLQGRIVSNGQKNTTELISDIGSIAKERSDIMIQGLQLRALNICSVHLEELGDEPDCVTSAPGPGGGLNIGQKAGIVIGIIAFAIIMVVSVGYMIYRKRRCAGNVTSEEEKHLVPEG